MRDFTDVDVERLLLGTAEPTDGVVGDLARVIARIRNEYASPVAPAVGAELATFVNLDLVGQTGDLLAEPAATAHTGDTAAPARSPVRQLRTTLRRRSGEALGTVRTFTGTLTAKVLLGGTFAVVAAGGAHAAGIVDIPGLPGLGQRSEVDIAPAGVVDAPPATTSPQVVPADEADVVATVPTGLTDRDQTAAGERGRTDFDGEGEIFPGVGGQMDSRDGSQTDDDDVDNDDDGAGDDGSGDDDLDADAGDDDEGEADDEDDDEDDAGVDDGDDNNDGAGADDDDDDAGVDDGDDADDGTGADDDEADETEAADDEADETEAADDEADDTAVDDTDAEADDADADADADLDPDDSDDD